MTDFEDNMKRLVVPKNLQTYYEEVEICEKSSSSSFSVDEEQEKHALNKEVFVKMGAINSAFCLANCGYLSRAA